MKERGDTEAVKILIGDRNWNEVCFDKVILWVEDIFKKLGPKEEITVLLL